VVRNVPSLALRVGGVFKTGTKAGLKMLEERDKSSQTGDCVFVFIFAQGRRDARGLLSIRAGDGEWVSMSQLSSALLTDTETSLCTLVVSTFCLGDASEPPPAQEPPPHAPSTASTAMLLPLRTSSAATLKIDNWRTLVQLWTMVPIESSKWIYEKGTVLNHLVTDGLSRAGECAYIEESLHNVLLRLDLWNSATKPWDPATPSTDGENKEGKPQGDMDVAYGLQVLGAGQKMFEDGQWQDGQVTGRGHRVQFRGQGVSQPSFSPTGNTLVDNDGALIKQKQWQVYSVHTNVVKVSMLTHTPEASIFYTIDGSDPDPSSLLNKTTTSGVAFGEGKGTRRYASSKALLLEFTGNGSQDFVVTALAMTPDFSQSRISRSPVYRVQGSVQSVTFQADRSDDRVLLKLDTATPDATIYYEECDTNPTLQHSQRYVAPLRLRSRTVICTCVCVCM